MPGKPENCSQRIFLLTLYGVMEYEGSVLAGMDFDGVKVFSATKAREREEISSRITEWLGKYRGKMTLVADFVRTRARPALWYQVDAGDGDPASLFHFLALAAKRAAPRSRRPLLRFAPEYLPGIAVFARRFFRDLFSRL